MVWRGWPVCSLTEPEPSTLPWPYKKMLFLLFELCLECRGLWSGWEVQSSSEGGKASRKKSVRVSMWASEKRGVGGMTGFHVRKWTCSLRTPVGVGVETRLTAWLASGNLPCFSRVKRTLFLLLLKSASALTVSASEYYSAAQWKVSWKSEDMFSLMPWEASICISPVWSQNWVQGIRRFPWLVMG